MDRAGAFTKRNSRDTPEGVQGEDSGKIRRPEGYGCEAPIHGTIHTTKKPYGLLLSSLARTAVRSDLLQKEITTCKQYITA
ncbi:hypothetical protein ACLKA7_007709 [Drosophila subpalustris]